MTYGAGYGVCLEYCPTQAINMDSDCSVIDRKKCIKCSCCQEFCPERAAGIRCNRLAKELRM